eukprot:5717390-Amphidinium_carterae.1
MSTSALERWLSSDEVTVATLPLQVTIAKSVLRVRVSLEQCDYEITKTELQEKLCLGRFLLVRSDCEDQQRL